jgi:HEAT repeat protein
LSLYLNQIDPKIESPDKMGLSIYTSDEFIDHVLDGLDIWGRSKYPAIMELIKRVGSAFTEPLLQRLADEPSMSRRRLFMECLQLIGRAAREPIIAHLHDKRWFFVRNLVILLRMMNDPAVLKYIGHLVGYPNSNVQFEVMRTFLHFNDPRADRYLIKKLESNDPRILINVTRLAANSRNPEVAQKLSEILNRKLLKESDENIKSAVIKSLAEMSLPDAFPELESFLLSRGLLQTMQGNSLKIEAVRSLLRYNDPAVADLAERVSRKSSGELAQVAKKVFQQLSEKRL